MFICGLTILQNAFFIASVSSFSNFSFTDEKGKQHSISFDENGLILMGLIKIVGSGLFIKMALEALRTFKPIVKDIEK